ncbi:hypothetical protein ACPW96_21960 [Micromonospora sp. DT81.3]
MEPNINDRFPIRASLSPPVGQLQTAYPNYYTNTTAFTDFVIDALAF